MRKNVYAETAAKPNETERNIAKAGDTRVETRLIFEDALRENHCEAERNQGEPRGEPRLDLEEALSENQNDAKRNQANPGEPRGEPRLILEEALCGFDFLCPRPLSLLKF